MKKSKIIGAALLLATVLGPAAAFAEEDAYLDADPEEKARRSHDLASSDMIYEPENIKALYYQNQAIIQILKEIKEELRHINIRQTSAAGGKETQE